MPKAGPLTVCSVVLASGLTAALARIGVVSAQGPAPSATPVSFNREILPILANNCFACHGPDEKKRETKFHFDTQEGMFLKKGVIEPGNAEESLLIEKITEPDPKERMPPPEKASPVASATGRESDEPVASSLPRACRRA